MNTSRKIILILTSLLAGAGVAGFALTALRAPSSLEISVGEEAFQSCFALARTQLTLSPAFAPVFLSQTVSATLMGHKEVTLIFEVPDGFVGSAVPYTVKCVVDTNGVRAPKIRKH